MQMERQSILHVLQRAQFTPELRSKFDLDQFVCEHLIPFFFNLDDVN